MWLETLITDASKGQGFQKICELFEDKLVWSPQKHGKALLNPLDRLINKLYHYFQFMMYMLQRLLVKTISAMMYKCLKLRPTSTLDESDMTNTRSFSELDYRNDIISVFGYWLLYVSQIFFSFHYMVLWFERTLEFLKICKDSTTTISALVEGFYDTAVVISKCDSEDGVKQLLDTFLFSLAFVVMEKWPPCHVRLEAIKTFNFILDHISKEERKKLNSSEEMSTLMQGLARKLSEVGDYDIQVGITEALCRMTPKKIRENFVQEWFEDRSFIEAFKEINDKDFETDCRKFLNFLNSRLKDNTRVYTFPCIRLSTDFGELAKPEDDKLEHFWIDFNVGSQGISFYIQNNKGCLWESVRLQKGSLNGYSLEECSELQVLTVHFKTSQSICNKEAKYIKMNFELEHDIQNAAMKTYGEDLQMKVHFTSPQHTDRSNHLGDGLTDSQKGASSEDHVSVTGASDTTSVLELADGNKLSETSSKEEALKTKQEKKRIKRCALCAKKLDDNAKRPICSDCTSKIVNDEQHNLLQGIRVMVREEVQALKEQTLDAQPGPSRKRARTEIYGISSPEHSEGEFSDNSSEVSTPILEGDKKFFFSNTDLEELISAVRNTMELTDTPQVRSVQDEMFGGLRTCYKKFFPVNENLRNLILDEWRKPTRGSSIQKEFRERLSFSAEDSSLWCIIPKVDVPVAKLTKETALPFEDCSQLKDPKKRKMEGFLKGVWESASTVIETNIAATSVARSLHLWLDQLDSHLHLKTPREELVKCLPLIKKATAFLADTSGESVRFAARNAALGNAARRALWLRSWAGDQTSKSRLCTIPLTGEYLFGPTLDKILEKAADKKLGFPTDYLPKKTTPFRKEYIPRGKGKGKTAPRVFTKIMIEPVRFLRERNIKIVPYLDDLLLIASDAKTMRAQKALDVFEFPKSSESASDLEVTAVKVKLLSPMASCSRQKNTPNWPRRQSSRKTEAQKQIVDHKDSVFSDGEMSWTLDYRRKPSLSVDYSRKRQKSKSRLKVLPLSSQSSDEGEKPEKKGKPLKYTGIKKGTRQRGVAESLSFSDLKLPGVSALLTPRHSQPQTSGTLHLSDLDQDTLDPLQEMSSPEVKIENPPPQSDAASKMDIESNEDQIGTKGLLPSGETADLKKRKQLSNEDEECALKPRKLFLSARIVSDVEDNVKSDSHESDITECSFISSFESFTEGLKKKMMSRYKRIEVRAQAVLTTSHLHVSNLMNQIQKSNFQKLEHFRTTVAQELSSLETETRALKKLEKETLDFWEAQTWKINEFCTNQRKRIEAMNHTINESLSSLKKEEEKTTDLKESFQKL
ncbi:synaptonemal complex protein 2-like [Eleutherodactylus coqui]|uniref:synaptonemal complex protein 2-like n=1 Tax=Eleutherodactylus coqui TaxID=57060 RepID=UPI00346312BC